MEGYLWRYLKRQDTARKGFNVWNQELESERMIGKPCLTNCCSLEGPAIKLHSQITEES